LPTYIHQLDGKPSTLARTADFLAMKRHPILPPQTYIAGDEAALEAAGQRITPLAPPPEWLRQFASGNLSALMPSEPHNAVEHQFWNSSPRDSAELRLSFSESLAQAGAPSRRWASRAALAACVIIALLGIEAIRVLI
jgi:hypothetical protein